MAFPAMNRNWPVLAFGSLLSCISTYWLACVNSTVRTPYLDEFFHVRQALTYWSHQWHIWDPKITTPPGLYLVSYVGLYLGRLFPSVDLLQQLRAHNVIGILLIFLVVNQLIGASNKRADTIAIAHTALNICLFPPLFFFSGLYYTDVISVLVVLKAHEAFQNRRPALVAFYSLLSLWFRQTNIFWTAAYLGGSEVIRQVKARQPSSKDEYTTPTWSNLVQRSLSDGIVHDLTVDSATIEGMGNQNCGGKSLTIIDYIKLIISLALATSRTLPTLIQPMSPYILTIGAFAGFVIWNGGVVLGMCNLISCL